MMRVQVPPSRHLIESIVSSDWKVVSPIAEAALKAAQLVVQSRVAASN
ncbi:hypothetical protein M23134_07201 [Microscilla marina ATCC 23134]|uniref:Uncharacterized protein n=1 Tax=Microscilla marina ATCC 23134 TaxID=313606 RepID=A1ZX31_MICM2|nr:hypothetical protein M23134_07201 [Microscilla marina ATCC 23134]